METIKIQVTAGGEVRAEWWTKDLADLFCEICRACPGWNHPEKKIDCVTGNPWCG
jgi:hypothetical protein